MQLGLPVQQAPWVPEALWAIQALPARPALLVSPAPLVLREIPVLRAQQVSPALPDLQVQLGLLAQKVP